MADLYKTLKKLCDERGITEAKMLKDCGVALSTMTELKSGRAKGMSAVKMQKIADYFGVSVSYILCGGELPYELTYKGMEEYRKNNGTQTKSEILDSISNIEEQLKELKEKTASKEENDLNQDERYLLDAYRTMTDEQKQMMNVFIRGLKND